MKKIILALMMVVSAVWADIKLDFILSARKKGCEVVHWIENDYENGVLWQQYAKVACKDPQSMPVRMVGLKFLDVSKNLKGEYIYTYGLEK
ncbi:MAG: hypothetical protein J6T74_08705 [Clostridia bacterium]|nr:hypothetical protein [Clostridia bacterium]